jgi:DNA polymerase-1
VKWLNQYGSLDGVIANASEISGVVGENLRGALAWLPMAKKLVTIKIDCDLSAYLQNLPGFDDLKLSPPQSESLVDFCEKFGFKGLIKTFGAAGVRRTQETSSSAELSLTDATEQQEAQDLFGEVAPKPSTIQERHYECITTWEQFERSFEAVQSAALVSLDTETDSLVQMKAQLIGISW